MANVRIVTRSEDGTRMQEQGANLPYPATITIDVKVKGHEDRIELRIDASGVEVEKHP